MNEGERTRQGERPSPTTEAWLRGAGGTAFGRHDGSGPLDLMAAAASQALASAALTRGDIDGLLCGYATTLPHLMLSTLFCERFVLRPRYAHGIQVGGATGSAMLMAARELVRAGRCRNVLVVAGENRLTGQARDQAIQTLMGRDVAPRFEFIMERAPRVDEVDV